MGTYIIIEKVSENDGIYCYKVSPSSCEVFFINLIVGSEKIYFYRDQNSSSLLGDVDFSDDQGLQPIDGLPSHIVGKVAFKAYRALKKEEFPDILSICS